MRDGHNLQALRVLRAMHYSSDLFPEPDYGFPGDQNTAQLRDHLFYKRFAWALIEGFRESDVPEGVKAPFRAALDWAREGRPADPVTPRDVPPPADPLTELRPESRSNVQGGVLKAYKTAAGEMMNAGLLVLLTFGSREAGGAFLRHVAPLIAPADAPEGAGPRVNLALTNWGLKTLALPERERLRFPHAFREGMEARAGMLGDVGVNSPLTWRLDRPGGLPPAHLETVDAVVQIQDRVAEERLAECCVWSEGHPLADSLAEVLGASVEQIRAGGVSVVSVEPMVRYEQGGRMVGHFGFADGVSQPKIGGIGPHQIPVGKMILGYEAEDASVETPEIMRDGSFMVVRKLAQNVPAFAALPEEVREKMIGRRPDGDPLTAPGAGNDFDFSHDRHGRLCPLNAHIRRANPRFRRGFDPVKRIETHHDAPRIMRRGFSYGSPVSDGSEAERGLMFICFNASIAEQFETIQRWIGGGNSTGLPSAQNDPLLGPAQTRPRLMFGDYPDPANPPETEPRWAAVPPGNVMRYVDNDQQVHRAPLGAEPFVRVRWGLYLFLPSRAAIREIADHALGGATAYEAAAMVARGRELLPTLTAEDDWKRILEDVDPRNRDRADDVVAHLCADEGGYYEGPGFVFVTDPDKVLEVLRKDRDFSVRGYWKRMKPIVGAAYLGMDPEVQPLSAITGDPSDLEYEKDAAGEYLKVAPVVNRFFGLFNDPARSKPLFERLFAVVRGSLTAGPLPAPEADPDLGGTRKLIDMEELIGLTASTFGLDWMGLVYEKTLLADGKTEVPLVPCPIDVFPYPLGAAAARSPNDFIETATHIYRPWAKPDDLARAHRLGARMKRTVVDWLAAFPIQNPGAMHHPERLVGFLKARFGPQGMTDAEIAEIVVNAAIGLHTPTTTSFAGIAYDWIRERTYWRLQDEFLGALADDGSNAFEAAGAILRKPMLASLARFASPEHLYRVAATETAAIAGAPVPPGTKVVVALGPAAKQDPARREELLFGGLYDPATPGAPVHACPGRGAGMAVMLATMAGLMASGHAVENSPLTLYLRPLGS